MPTKTVKGIGRFTALVVLTIGLAGCIYANTTMPLTWVSNTRLDVKDLTLENQEIVGQSTAHALLFGMISWGDAGLDAALEDAKRKAQFEVKEVYDVKTDQKVFNVLGLYISRTIIVTAKVAH
jgi:hypothetical protein